MYDQRVADLEAALAAIQIKELAALEKVATKDWCSGCPDEGRLFASGHGAEIANFRKDWSISRHEREANVRIAIALRNAAPQLLALVREIPGMLAALAAKDAEIERLKAWAAKHEGLMEAQDRALAMAESALKGRDAEIVTLRQQVFQHEQWLKADSLHGENERLRSQLAAAQRDSVDLQRTIERLVAEEKAAAKLHALILAEKAAAEQRAEEAVTAYIDQNSITCDCCQHVMIDVTAAKTGEKGHCTAGDPEGDGVGCAHSLHAQGVELEQQLAAEKQAREEETARLDRRANHLWPPADGSVEAIGYEFANARTEEYSREMWLALLDAARSSTGSQS